MARSPEGPGGTGGRRNPGELFVDGLLIEDTGSRSDRQPWHFGCVALHDYARRRPGSALVGLIGGNNDALTINLYRTFGGPIP